MKFTWVIILFFMLLIAGCKSNLPEIENENVEVPQEIPVEEVIADKQEEINKGRSFEEKYWEERINATFEPVDCPLPPKRNLPDSYYKGPMIDAHIHFHSLPDAAPSLDLSELRGDNLGTTSRVDDWICMLNYEGTKKAFVFFPVWDPIIEQSLDVVKKALEKYPDHFVPFIMPPDNDGSPHGSSTVDAKKLRRMLEVYPGLFRGYGEIGLYHRHEGAAALPPNSKRLKEIYPVVREHNLVVYFHLGEGQKDAFEEVLKENPDITFIWHGDQLIQCESCKKNLDDVAEILENHPNVYYGVDELYGDVFLLRPHDGNKKEFLDHFKDYEPLLEKDLETWKDFIEDHPDQVLWDTDRGIANWSTDLDVALTLNNYTRAFIGHLDPAIQEKFAYKNAERLIQA